MNKASQSKTKIFPYNVFSARRIALLFALLLLLLISVSSVLALITTVVQPGAGVTFENTLMYFNATTDDYANCTYNFSDGSTHLIASLNGNNSFNHSISNTDISSLNDGTVYLTADCVNASNPADIDSDTIAITKATDAPQITWNNPTQGGVSSLGSTVVLNITATITGQRGIDQSKLDVFNVTDCGGTLTGSPTYSCGTPANVCNVTQTWNVPSAINVNCTLKANVTTSMDSIWNQTEINVSVHPKCGDTITSSLTLGLDITGCSGNALDIDIAAIGITLDCNGHHLSGPGTGSGIGIALNGADGVTIKNCSLTNFLYGITIDVDSDNNKIIYNNVSAAKRGLFVSSPVAGNNVSDNYFANNEEGIRFATPAAVGAGNNKIYHNNIFGNILWGAYSGTSASAELSYNGQGNYWGNSACPLFTPGTDASPAGIIDSFPFNETDGWTMHGPGICTVPNVTLKTPTKGATPLIYSMFNFSVNVTDLYPVTGVTVYNGTGDQVMIMSGADPTNAIWWALVDLTVFTDGAQNLAVNATNGGQYNDSEYFTVVVDNTGPTFNLASPVDNYNTSNPSQVLNYYVYDDYATGANLNCTLYLYNSTGNLALAPQNNASVVNNTLVSVVALLPGPGTYYWNVTCDDFAYSNVLMGLGNINSSYTNSFTYDPIPPTPVSSGVAEPDNFVSGQDPNHNITAILQATDTGTGVASVTANFSQITDNPADAYSMVYNGTHWVYTFSTSPADTFDAQYEPENVTFVITDYAGNTNTIMFATVILYNMSVPETGDPCVQFAPGTTNFSVETDFYDVDFTVVVDWRYSVACGYFGPGADDLFHKVAKINFTGLDFSNPATGQKLAMLDEALQVTITPDGNFGESRVYINSTFFAELDTTASIELYDLPFDNLPNVTADADAAGFSAGSVVYTNYTNPTLGKVGNLSFTVAGFSGYNVSDITSPIITVNDPTPNSTFVGGSFVINLTLNGTGTQISNVQVNIDALPAYTRAVMTCYNATGSEMMNCYFNPGAIPDGVHTMTVTAWDFGVTAPGNMAQLVWNFTSDTTAPVVSGASRNASVVGQNTPIQLNLSSVTDTTNVSSVSAKYTTAVPMTNHTPVAYGVTTTAAALGCTVHGTCTVTFNATDYWGNSNTAVTTSFTVDKLGPGVGSGATNASSNTAKSTTGINFTMVAVDANSQVVSADLQGTPMSPGASNSWTVTTTPVALGCAPNAACLLTFNATDSFGNSNSTYTLTITTDDTAPTNSSPFSAPSPGSSSASVYSGAALSESAICVVNYSTNASNLNLQTSSAAFSSTGAVSLSGLTASMVYYFKVMSCRDAYGNVNTFTNGVQNFTTTAAAAPPSGGGGGGGGGGMTLAYTAGDMTGATSDWNMARGDTVTFMHDGSEYSLTMNAVSSAYARITFDGVASEEMINVGETKAFDLDKDASADLEITLIEIEYGKADMRVHSLTMPAQSPLAGVLPPGSVIRGERPAAEQPAQAGEAAAGQEVETAPAAPDMTGEAVQGKPVTDMLAPEVVESEGTDYWWAWLLGLIVVAAIVVGLYEMKKKKTQ